MTYPWLSHLGLDISPFILYNEDSLDYMIHRACSGSNILQLDNTIAFSLPLSQHRPSLPLIRTIAISS